MYIMFRSRVSRILKLVQVEQVYLYINSIIVVMYRVMIEVINARLLNKTFGPGIQRQRMPL